MIVSRHLFWNQNSHSTQKLTHKDKQGPFENSENIFLQMATCRVVIFDYGVPVTRLQSSWHSVQILCIPHAIIEFVTYLKWHKTDQNISNWTQRMIFHWFGWYAVIINYLKVYKKHNNWLFVKRLVENSHCNYA